MPVAPVLGRPEHAVGDHRADTAFGDSQCRSGFSGPRFLSRQRGRSGAWGLLTGERAPGPAALLLPLPKLALCLGLGDLLLVGLGERELVAHPAKPGPRHADQALPADGTQQPRIVPLDSVDRSLSQFCPSQLRPSLDADAEAAGLVAHALARASQCRGDLLVPQVGED